MKTSFYLVVNRKGSTRTVKTKPGLNWDEVSIKLDLSLPDALFQKPQITAKIDVSNSNVTPFELTAETIDNVKAAIEQHTGLPIKIEVVHEAMFQKC